MLAVDLLQMGHAMLDAPAAERKGLADDALSLKRQTLRQKQARLGDAHPECLQEQEHLASLLKRADRYAESVEEYEKVMPQLEATIGNAPGQAKTMLAMSQDNFGIGENTASHLPKVRYRHPRACCGMDSPYPHAVAADSLARAVARSASPQWRVRPGDRATAGGARHVHADPRPER